MNVCLFIGAFGRVDNMLKQFEYKKLFSIGAKIRDGKLLAISTPAVTESQSNGQLPGTYEPGLVPVVLTSAASASGHGDGDGRDRLILLLLRRLRGHHLSLLLLLNLLLLLLCRLLLLLSLLLLLLELLLLLLLLLLKLLLLLLFQFGCVHLLLLLK